MTPALISGGKKNRKRADLAQDMNYNRSTSCSHCEVRMCWGKGLTFLTWTVKSAMKELKQRPEFKDHDFYVTVYWSGNELVGSGGICDEPEWPYRCGDGHWPELFNKCAKAIDVLEECRSWWSIAIITILANTEGSYYMLPPIYNQFMENLLKELYPSKPGWPDTTLVISHSKRMAVNAAANRALAPEASKLLELETQVIHIDLGCYESVTTQNGCSQTQNSPQSMRVWPQGRLCGRGGSGVGRSWTTACG